MSEYLTMRDLRKLTGLPTHSLNHAIERHGPEPTTRIGTVRVWLQSALPAIHESLRKTGALSRTEQPVEAA